MEHFELINQGINTIPREFNDLGRLESLNLSWNRDIDLTEIDKLNNLRHVKITNIDLDTMPLFVENVRDKIETLDISYNNIREFEENKNFISLKEVGMMGLSTEAVLSMMQMTEARVIYVDEQVKADIENEFPERKVDRPYLGSGGYFIISENSRRPRARWAETRNNIRTLACCDGGENEDVDKCYYGCGTKKFKQGMINTDQLDWLRESKKE